MENLTYMTGNYRKYVDVKQKFGKKGIEINYYKCDVNEPDVNDIKVISKEKARQGYEIIGKPVFVTDSGFYIEDYPNNPGAFAKRSGVSSNIEKLLETMKNVGNRKSYFLDCLTFYDGNEFYQFFGISHGTLSKEIKGHEKREAKSNLWYVFILEGYTKTLSEMSEEKLSDREHGDSATEKFIDWYQNEYLHFKRRVRE